MTSVAKLYTPEILALAVQLATAPLDPAMPLQGRSRSPSCGSTLALSLRLDAQGLIAEAGAQAQACAIGQASTALFMAGARGRSAADIAGTCHALQQWLAGDGPQPDWPALELLAPARAYPARHGAMLLPWNAALDALSSG